MKTLSTIVLVVCCLMCRAQINITPIVGVNSVRMDQKYSYEKGGNYFLGGMELEFQKRPKEFKRLHISGVTGISFLNNGYYEWSSLSVTTLLYSRQETNLKTKFVQVPIEARFNWQPFVLIDDFKVFLGVGVSNDFLMKASLEENSTRLILDVNPPVPPPQTVQYADSKDIKEFFPSYLLFGRFELGMKIKRVQLAWRTSISFSDAYPKGLEQSWRVPDDDSIIISTYEDTGKIRLKYVDLVIGYRFLR